MRSLWVSSKVGRSYRGSDGLCSRDSFKKLGLEGGERERGLRRSKRVRVVSMGFFCFVFYLCVRTGAQVRG